MTTYLEAKRTIAEFRGGPELRVLVAMSGTADPLALYLQAAGARLGVHLMPAFLPFNTLQQHLAAPATAMREAILVTPWDLLPEADWRSGIPAARMPLADATERARGVSRRLASRPQAALHYLPAPIPPLTGLPAHDEALAHTLRAIATEAGARLLPDHASSLSSYFASGCPIGGASLGLVADSIVERLVAASPLPAKVLVTDFDNTLWHGVIAEDGPDGVAFRPEGSGFRHFIYQGLLKRLKEEGVLLVGVSRNDPEIVRPPLESCAMPLRAEDFVVILASYHAKSAQIRQLAQELNLGLDAFIFVDDNPVELEEVGRALPSVQRLRFPDREDDLPGFLAALAARFGRSEVTLEDRDRTALYQRRVEGMAPADASGAELDDFLGGLSMKLVLHDRTTGDRTRAVQLINKTNQFNANGRRWTDAEVDEVLAGGGRLFGATLSDRTGSHGEVIACLVDAAGTVQAMVMSCRVFQRRAEYAFLAELLRGEAAPRVLLHARTDRNEPYVKFLGDPAFSEARPGEWEIDAERFLTSHARDRALIEVKWD